MSIQQYIDKMKKIQEEVLAFINNDDDIEQNFQKLIEHLEYQNIKKDKHEFKSFLYLISNISSNHHRSAEFNTKIDQILQYFSQTISENFTNNEIFHIFESSKRSLLFLIENSVLTIEKSIYNKFLQIDSNSISNYIQYFYPEVKQFIEEDKQEQNLVKNFEEKRRIGENDSYICEVIRNDSVDEFIEYFKGKTSSIYSICVENSIFETNNLLLHKNISIIDYIFFHGSNQIIQYVMQLIGKGFIYIFGRALRYSIHSNNSQLIQFLLEKNSSEFIESLECEIELIKCHHNELRKFLKQDKYEDKIFNRSLQYYNFEFIDINHINKMNFYHLCKYDYFTLVKILANSADFNVNCEKVFFK